MTGQTKLEPDIAVWLRQYAHAVWTGEDQGCRMLEAAELIERLRTSSIGWEEAIEAAAKVADETAALEDKHDRYEAYRAAHDIAQTIRSLLPSSGREDGEGLREAVIEECAKVADNATRQVCRGDFGLVGPAGIGMKIAQAIRALSSGRDGRKP